MTERDLNCDEALKGILAYLDRELGEQDHAAMQRHLHTCKSCFSRMEFERLLKGKIRSLRDKDAAAGLGARIKALLKAF
jgi:anti-sigma factor (TIGR02949 family)